MIQQLLQKDPAKRPASASRRHRAAARTPRAGARAEVPTKSIAVLYFENMSSERESDYFCAGITEDIITDLSKVSELRVVSRTDMLPFRNKEINIRQVGGRAARQLRPGRQRPEGGQPHPNHGAAHRRPQRLPRLGRPIRRPHRGHLRSAERGGAQDHRAR